jgi:hypothetical protein
MRNLIFLPSLIKNNQWMKKQFEHEHDKKEEEDIAEKKR